MGLGLDEEGCSTILNYVTYVFGWLNLNQCFHVNHFNFSFLEDALMAFFGERTQDYMRNPSTLSLLYINNKIEHKVSL